jgi:hypothetical protein
MASTAAVTFTPTTITLAGNAGIAGAVISWTDGSAKTATADTSGNYSIIVPYLWSGTVTPSLTGYTFTPVNRTYTNGAADQPAQNFTSDAITYTISGNAGAAGATVSWKDGSAKTATADSLGAYSFTVSYNWSGTVTPSQAGYMFTPESLAYANVLEPKLQQNYAATPYVNANLKVFLSGPYSNGTMTTTLANQGLIPLTSESAYAASTYGYTARTVSRIPAAGIVDWVLVELRTGTPGSTKTAVQAAFMKNNGSIVDTNGVSPLLFKGISAGNFYVVIRHRNHLPVMSAAAVSLNAASAQYDFTTSVSKAFGTNPMMALTGGGFGMWAGDVNRNGNVKYTGSQNDRTVLLSVVGPADPTLTVPGYLNADVNMDGKAKFTGSNNDATLILKSVGPADPTKSVISQVPN